jgi:predicted TIM-barrel fold metal-dependent hydrolase
VDTSWQVTPNAIELLVEHAGPDRILFGSSAPVRPIQPALNTVLDAEIDVEIRRKILSINALKLFGRQEQAAEVERRGFALPETRKPATSAIDVHCHLGVLPEVPMKMSDVDSIVYHVEREGFEYAICSAPVAYREDVDLGNREMLEKITGHPKLLGSPVITPTHMETSIKWLDMFARNDKLAHATLDPDNEAERAGSDAYMKLLAEAAIRKVPIFYNSGAQDLSSGFRWQRKLGYNPWIRGTSQDEFVMFVEVDRRHPDLPIIIGHGMGEDGLRLAAQTRNIHLELSGSYPERDAVRKAIDQIGADRVVFGTDLDMITPAFALGVYDEANMTPDEERLVMAENARRILRVPG